MTKKEPTPFPPGKLYTVGELRKSKNPDIVKGVERFTDDHKVWCNPDHVGFDPNEALTEDPVDDE